MKHGLLSLCTLLCCITAMAQKPIVVPLWPNGTPNDNGLTDENIFYEGGRCKNITTPYLYVYPAEKPTGKAVLMCPGGGYHHTAMTHEGTMMADWFNAQGITYAVLLYRMPNGHCEVPSTDAAEALRLMRQQATAWRLDPHKVGIMGGSAGGHLAITIANNFTTAETRPDFQILLYPVVSMNQGTHSGSKKNLLGENPSQKDIERLDFSKRINPNTPKAFIVASADDHSVSPVGNTLPYVQQLIENDIPVSLHIYPIGAHGWGFNDNFTYKTQWTDELEKWLREEIK